MRSPAPTTCLPLAVLCLAGTLPTVRGTEATAIAIGAELAVVRERVALQFPSPAWRVPFAFMPDSADLSSLSVAPVSSPVQLASWQRDAAGVVQADLLTDFAGARPFDVLYATTGLSWHASYQLVVRADPEREDAPVSMDVDGRITVHNQTRAAWSNALLRFIGAPLRTGQPREPGFMELDEMSPLADLWNAAAHAEAIPHAYALDRRVALHPGEERAFTFVSVERRPAERRYRMTSDDVPVGTREPGRSLLRFIALRNDSANGLGRDLPPGTAQIFRGSTRASLGESAWLERTPANGEIRIDLGPSARVRGIRRAFAQTPGAPGEVEQEFEIEIRNELDSRARIEIEEQPPAPQTWAMVRSSHVYTVRNRRLNYRVDVEGKESLFVRYTIRMPVRNR